MGGFSEKGSWSIEVVVGMSGGIHGIGLSKEWDF
jgi:hypothetical protein